MIFDNKKKTFKYEFLKNFYICYNTSNLTYCQFLDKIVYFGNIPIFVPYTQEYKAKFFKDKNNLINIEFVKIEGLE